MTNIESLRHFIPEMILLSGAFITLFTDFMTRNKRVVGLLGIAFLITTAFLSVRPAEPQALFFGFFLHDGFTHFFRLLALGVVAITLLVSLTYEKIAPFYRSEYVSLFMFMAFGLILMAGAANLLMIFLAIEFVSLLSYLLTGFLKNDARSKEASLKYLLFGSVASALMLYGMSLIFGITGSLNLEIIRDRLMLGGNLPLVLVSLALILAGLGFKISMAPFHMWAPDVYEGAPTPVTGFLTVAPKALGFAVLIRVLHLTFAGYFDHWTHLIAALSIVTMTLGNFIALTQTNIKRLLAYSSIAQAGYILMGIAVFSQTGLSGVVIYLLAYAFTNLGAFTVVVAVSNQLGDDFIESYAGLSKRAPLVAASMAIFLLSLAGIPPLAGFIAKFYVFAAAIESGYIVLAIAAAINSAVAAYYYFRVVRAMYLLPAREGKTISIPESTGLALLLLLGGTLLIGLFPSTAIDAVQALFTA